MRQLSGHSKAVNCVKFASQTESLADDFILSGSSDSTVKVWKGDSCVHTLAKVHSGSVLCLDVHPTMKYFITGSKDKTWAFSDIESGTCMQKVSRHYHLTISDLSWNSVFWKASKGACFKSFLSSFTCRYVLYICCVGGEWLELYVRLPGIVRCGSQQHQIPS